VSEPFTAFSFRVEITLPGAAEPLCEAAFAQCDGMEMRFDVLSLSEGGDNAGRRLFAGPASTGRVTLKRGMTSSLDLWDWCAAVGRDPALRADARVVVLAPDGEEDARFLLRRCLPVRLKAPPLDAVAGVVAVEELELACESLAREGPDSAPDPPHVRKAELRELDDALRKEVNKDRWVRVPVNPSNLTLSFPTGDAVGRLAVELWCDGDDVLGLTQRIAYFAGKGSPPVRFVWGELRFDGHVEALDETLDFFSPDGRPLRARLSLSLRGETLPA
jgi:phage tail-like protein